MLREKCLFIDYHRSIYQTLLLLSDNLMCSLEFRLDNILQRTGFFSPQEVRQLISHRKILVNGNVITNSNYIVAAGSIVSFNGFKMKKYVIHNFVKIMYKFKRLRKLLRRKRVSLPILRQYMNINKSSYLSFSF